MTTHTPGPWHMEGAPLEYEIWTGAASQGNTGQRLLARVEDYRELEERLTDTPLNVSANARLIAAAPELLEAAKAVNQAEKQLDITTQRVVFSLPRDTVELLAAAIATAEGND